MPSVDGFKNLRSNLITAFCWIAVHSAGPIAQRGERRQYNRLTASLLTFRAMGLRRLLWSGC